MRLPALGDSVSEDFDILAERRLGERIMREVRRDPAYMDDPQLLEKAFVDAAQCAAVADWADLLATRWDAKEDGSMKKFSKQAGKLAEKYRR